MVTIAKRIHLFPYRTQKLSSLVSKILGWRRPGKIESCHLKDKREKISSLFYHIRKLSRRKILPRVAVGNYTFPFSSVGRARGC